MKFTKTPRFDGKLAEKLGCKVHKEGVGLFVWAKLPEGSVSAEKFIQILQEKSIFIAPGTIFGSNGEGYIRFALCVKEEKYRKQLIDFDSSQSLPNGEDDGCV
jgi:aspartate/methionine/tyrosine aminotransferase